MATPLFLPQSRALFLRVVNAFPRFNHPGLVDTDFLLPLFFEQLLLSVCSANNENEIERQLSKFSRH